MQTTITRKIYFDAAHRVAEHESKCKNLHGHRYTLEAKFTAKKLDNLGRIIDFGVIKERLGSWIDENWDHNTILWEGDREIGAKISSVTGQMIFYLENNPTAENMAAYIFQEVCPELFKDTKVKCISVKLYETPNCVAEVE